MAESLAKNLIKEAHYRVFIESVPRICQCLDLLSAEEIWRRPNEQSNSVGNLVLHLCGNVRQYVVHGLGKVFDDRIRDEEFVVRNETDGHSQQELEAMLTQLQKDCEQVFSTLTEADLMETKSIQGFQITGLSALVHITEHFSYHTGQITLLTKLYRNVDTGYYAGFDLNTTNS